MRSWRRPVARGATPQPLPKFCLPRSCCRTGRPRVFHRGGARRSRRSRGSSRRSGGSPRSRSFRGMGVGDRRNSRQPRYRRLQRKASRIRNPGGSPRREPGATEEFVLPEPAAASPEAAPAYGEFDIPVELPAAEDQSTGGRDFRETAGGAGIRGANPRRTARASTIFEEQPAPAPAEDLPAPLPRFQSRQPPSPNRRRSKYRMWRQSPRNPNSNSIRTTNWFSIRSPWFRRTTRSRLRFPSSHSQPETEPVAQNAATPPPASAFASDQFLADLANEIDQLGIGEPAPAFSEPAAAGHPRG